MHVYAEQLFGRLFRSRARQEQADQLEIARLYRLGEGEVYHRAAVELAAHGRHAVAAVAAHDGGHALEKVGLHARVHERAEVGVAVRVDKAWGQRPAGGVYDMRGRAAGVPHGGDAPVLHGYAAGKCVRAGAVVNYGVFNEYIVHVPPQFALSRASASARTASMRLLLSE